MIFGEEMENKIESIVYISRKMDCKKEERGWGTEYL